ncbi:aminopeptidase [Paenibacillus baekrokdamisoli]|uniref:Aminopeptidase n=1 Tax=Paenibacillus baekrokdamisoli TaxID=1712516 RepID=A0A3G9JIL7_9BACL|nr:aminopeptidase [Paenibacillus baekrokdamisoli]MBB3068142.1 aminopeptidase [Paenibacillus baekrokdamisoli]BBH22814.1 aminopeptidase [Paenibacillus baekrokdamisoli]
MYPTQKHLEHYASLAVKVGVNVQEGQTVVVMAPIAAAPLVRLIASKAYEAGAKNVHVEYNDEELTLIKYKQAPEEAFTEYPMWRAKAWEEFAENGAAFIQIYSPNPNLLNDVDPTRVATASKAASTALNKYRSTLMNHTNAWSLISYATPEWAAKVFPDLSTDEAVQKLWERIIDATRIDLEDPIQAWRDHNAKLLQMVELLNGKRYKQLQYEAPGTSLTVDLPEGHIWLGGAKANAKGVLFNPNMPTEEVFTMPHRDGVNGTVRSTKPLNYNGQVINDFSLTFKAGKVIDFSAQQGYEALSNLLNTDEGARHLGEIALVPHDSPISNSNVIFFNTLYDENASCHLALGQAYPVNIEGGTKMQPEELLAHGANRSLTHEDFMIGSPDMNIDGVTQDGKLEPIFRNGNWAI